jgi:Ca2+-binding RTX toxin-like protein
MRFRAGVLLVVVCAALAAAPQSWAPVYGYDEPAATKGTTNYWWFNYDVPSGAAREAYCFELYSGATKLRDSGCTPYFSAGTSGNFSVYETGLTPGVTYTMHPSRYSEGIGFYPQGTYGFTNRTTVIDTTAPTINVWTNGTDTYTRNPILNIHIEYHDQHSRPWPANTVCTQAGSACTPTNYEAYCSTPYLLDGYDPPYDRYFDCTVNASGMADGLIVTCVRAADGALEDKPLSTNQFGGTASQANWSDTGCGSIYLDRAAPAVSISASDTNPVTGSLVTFTANVSDATSGVNPAAVAWDLNNDGTTDKTGQTVTYTYTTPATFDVTAKVSDNAGNVGTGTVRIGVHAPGQAAPGYIPPPGSPASTATGCTIFGSIENDVLKGTAGKDIICGSLGNDKISGLGGNDTLRGGPGNDTIVGGPGKDVMNGEAGKDKLLAKNAGTDRLNGGPGRDSGNWNGADRARAIERRLA